MRDSNWCFSWSRTVNHHYLDSHQIQPQAQIQTILTQHKTMLSIHFYFRCSPQVQGAGISIPYLQYTLVTDCIIIVDKPLPYTLTVWTQRINLDTQAISTTKHNTKGVARALGCYIIQKRHVSQHNAVT